MSCEATAAHPTGAVAVSAGHTACSPPTTTTTVVTTTTAAAATGTALFSPYLHSRDAAGVLSALERGSVPRPAEQRRVLNGLSRCLRNDPPLPRERVIPSPVRPLRLLCTTPAAPVPVPAPVPAAPEYQQQRWAVGSPSPTRTSTVAGSSEPRPAADAAPFPFPPTPLPDAPQHQQQYQQDSPDHVATTPPHTLSPLSEALAPPAAAAVFGTPSVLSMASEHLALAESLVSLCPSLADELAQSKAVLTASHRRIAAAEAARRTL